jgi:hypothetical protein
MCDLTSGFGSVRKFPAVINVLLMPPKEPLSPVQSSVHCGMFRETGEFVPAFPMFSLFAWRKHERETTENFPITDPSSHLPED